MQLQPAIIKTHINNLPKIYNLIYQLQNKLQMHLFREDHPH